METKTKQNTLENLAELGQSPWYDNLDRRLIKNGELKKLFNTGILGVTSNPSIFEKAVSASDEYDEEIKKLAAQGKSVLDIYNSLTIKDVTDAADLLRETYENTEHLDGYVSIEVLPDLAHDTKKTIEFAREILSRIRRPNIMIKVPGTEEGYQAIRVLTSEGINVNATLVFSTEQYEASARAYTEGLRDRLKEDKNIRNIYSVASIFVSRIDTRVDKLLDDLKEDSLKGKIAVANSKMIYQKFKKLFNTDEFRKLEQRGANRQRVLWASTGTKNPSYSDLKYVEELIALDTVNTMPPSTINAFLDHGKVELRAAKDLDMEKGYLDKLKALGLNIEEISRQIQDEGVKAFQDSFDKLIRAIEQKMQA